MWLQDRPWFTGHNTVCRKEMEITFMLKTSTDYVTVVLINIWARERLQRKSASFGSRRPGFKPQHCHMVPQSSAECDPSPHELKTNMSSCGQTFVMLVLPPLGKQLHFWDFLRLSLLLHARHWTATSWFGHQELTVRRLAECLSGHLRGHIDFIHINTKFFTSWIHD